MINAFTLVQYDQLEQFAKLLVQIFVSKADNMIMYYIKNLLPSIHLFALQNLHDDSLCACILGILLFEYFSFPAYLLNDTLCN